MSITLTLYGQLSAHLFGKMECHVMLIVKPFYLINLIRLITFLGFQDNDVMSLTRDGGGWVGHWGIPENIHIIPQKAFRISEGEGGSRLWNSEGKGGLKHGSRPWLGMDIFWDCPLVMHVVRVTVQGSP